MKKSDFAHHGIGAAARGFSLIEMLTVLAIIAVVAGILIPTLNNARTTARRGATLTIMKDIGGAIGQFELDRKRMPGYFPQRAMGSTDNRDLFGFTTMENMVLDLAGGIVDAATPDLTKGIIQVGPAASARVFVSVGQIGSPTQSKTGTIDRGYYKPDLKYFVAQSAPDKRLAVSDTASGAERMPVVVDAFGQPILAWAQDGAAASTSDFAREHSGAYNNNSVQSAKFYWASNAGFLLAKSLGKRGEDQTIESMLTRSDDAGRVRTLQALCGNPAFPDPATATVPVSDAGGPKPLQARAPVVLHSAGYPGVYLWRGSRGAKVASSAVNKGVDDSSLLIPYRPNQDLITSGGFDDVISTAGN